LNTTKRNINREVIGLIPAAGDAKRIAPLPCSKELYPIGFEIEKELNLQRPKSVCQYLIEKMHYVGVEKIYFILRKGKWDIPSYLGDGSRFRMNFAYLIMGLPFGVPYTLDQAFPFIKENIVVLGFPDIMFESKNSFQKLIGKIESCNYDIVLGLFPSDRPERADLVGFDKKGKARKIVRGKKHTRLRYTWGIAAWTPVFTNYLHEKLKDFKATTFIERELSINDIINMAIQDGSSACFE
jgi:glucose-1-phosphate thymidylyltransferase